MFANQQRKTVSVDRCFVVQSPWSSTSAVLGSTTSPTGITQASDESQSLLSAYSIHGLANYITRVCTSDSSCACSTFLIARFSKSPTISFLSFPRVVRRWWTKFSGIRGFLQFSAIRMNVSCRCLFPSFCVWAIIAQLYQFFKFHLSAIFQALSTSSVSFTILYDFCFEWTMLNSFLNSSIA